MIGTVTTGAERMGCRQYPGLSTLHLIIYDDDRYLGIGHHYYYYYTISSSYLFGLSAALQKGYRYPIQVPYIG